MPRHPIRSLLIGSLFTVGTVAALGTDDVERPPDDCARRGYEEACEARCREAMAPLERPLQHEPLRFGACFASGECGCFAAPFDVEGFSPGGPNVLFRTGCAFRGKLGDCFDPPWSSCLISADDDDNDDDCTQRCEAIDDLLAADAATPVRDARFVSSSCTGDCECNFEVDGRCTTFAYGIAYSGPDEHRMVDDATATRSGGACAE